MPSFGKYHRLAVVVSLLLLVGCSHGVKLSQEQWLNGSQTTRAFSEAGETLHQLSYEVLSTSGRRLGLATLLEQEGYLVTKSSELPMGKQKLPFFIRSESSKLLRLGSRFGELRVRAIGSESSIPARVVAIHHLDDLALLQTTSSPPLPRWTESHSTGEADWVASLDPDLSVKIGVVGAPARPIERDGGTLGVLLEYLESLEEGVSIASVVDDSPADRVGLESKDVIVAVDNKLMREVEGLREELRKRDPGETVHLSIRRGQSLYAVDVVLGRPDVLRGGDVRNQKMSGPTSSRRAGFSQVIQHDTPLKPKAMGGPLVNIKGEVIGINIARADRVTTYALPISLVQKRIRELFTLMKESESAGPPSSDPH